MSLGRMDRRWSATAGMSGVAGIVLIAVVATVAVTSTAVLIAGANPLEAWYQFFLSPLTSDFRRVEVLVSATPLLLCGLAVAIAFRAGYWNIGVEGQLLMGAVAAGGIGQVVHDLPPLVAIPSIQSSAGRLPAPGGRWSRRCCASGSASMRWSRRSS